MNASSPLSATYEGPSGSAVPNEDSLTRWEFGGQTGTSCTSGFVQVVPLGLTAGWVGEEERESIFVHLFQESIDFQCPKQAFPLSFSCWNGSAFLSAAVRLPPPQS